MKNQGKAAIFYGMMIIDIQVPFRSQFQVNQRVLRQEIEHVVKEGHPGLSLNEHNTFPKLLSVHDFSWYGGLF